MPTQNPPSDRPVEAHVYLLGTFFFFGTAFTSSKVVVGEIPHQVAAVLRFGGGALILLAVLAVAGRSRGGVRFSRREMSRAGLVGLIGVFGYNMFFFWGLSLAPSVDGSIIVPVLSPVLTTVALLAMKRETASVPRIVGLALGLAGAAVFFAGAGDGSTLNGTRLTGDLVFLLGAGCWAAYSITSKQLLAGMDPLRATTIGTCAGALGLLLFALPSASSVQWGSVPATTWLNVVYLAVGPTAVAYLFFYRGLRAVSPSTATVLMFTVPVFGVTSSVIFLGESFTDLQILGTAVMLVGALLAVTQGRFGQRRRRLPPEAAAERPEHAEPVDAARR